MKEETASEKKNLIIALIITAILAAALCLAIVFRMYAGVSSKDEHHYQQYVVKYVPALVESGKVAANRTQTLQKPAGTVKKIHVQNGDEVKKGEVLLTTRNKEITSKITTAKQEILKTQRDLAVQKQSIANSKTKLAKMHKGESEDDLNLELARDQNTYRDTEVDLQNQHDQLNQLYNQQEEELKAPFPGVISITNDDETGQAQYSLSSSEMEAQSSVSEYDYDKLHSGAEATVKALANGKKQTTTVKFLAKIPAKAMSKKNFSMYDFTVPVDHRFMVGQSVQIVIPQKQIKLPSQTILNEKGQTIVYLVIHGKAKRHAVKVEKQNGFYFLKSGLQPGQHIVANPDKRLKDGAKVN
ncbi:biotin/lipoyl-binding protein [Sporolactobacillus shoreicorticis]|uniref:Efflux RND transporter periplasmic adaptor subunit n=1 Tax=Sporolactobacillus shoreicorticis TaxID=1923877 RepID=A0ABW5S811_9BACL|nr:biotin/lipoyl-binding protein [Sporolactobacillus shoreicorticis]MCO7128203.1 biotin/lipoyl-binding protein [Sporolactobacillus shoreicorticis]